MAREAKQTKNGKAFEYALLIFFLERLQIITSVSVIESEPCLTAKNVFSILTRTNKVYII